MTPAVSRPHAVIRRPAKPDKPLAKLSSLDVSRLHVETHADPKTIRRWATGRQVKACTALALARGCERLGIEVRA